MTNAALLEQIRPGMKVLTADGKHLGRIRQVHEREAECFVEVTSEAAKWKFWQLELKTLFLPASAVDAVEGKLVHLHMDASTARGCTWRPAWIPMESIGDNVARLGTGGGGG